MITAMRRRERKPRGMPIVPISVGLMKRLKLRLLRIFKAKLFLTLDRWRLIM